MALAVVPDAVFILLRRMVYVPGMSYAPAYLSTAISVPVQRGVGGFGFIRTWMHSGGHVPAA